MGEALLIFKSITKLTEVEDVLRKLLSSLQPLHFQGTDALGFTLSPQMLGSNMDLRCTPPENSPLPEGIFSTSFHINDEKYILETKIEKNEDNVCLRVKNLFHVQRRKNFRYVLPKNYCAIFKFKTLNHLPSIYSCRLLDLSTEGCAIEVEVSDFKVPTAGPLEAEILLGSHAPIKVQGIIKNIREKDELRWVLGIEFNHLAAASEHKIVNAIADLQRDIYLKNAA